MLANHTEYIHKTLSVLRFVLPLLVEYFDAGYAGGFEDFALFRLLVKAPYVYVVGRERKRLYPAVASRVCRLVVAQYDLSMAFDGINQRVNISCVATLDHRVGQRAGVVHRVQFVFEVLF